MVTRESIFGFVNKMNGCEICYPFEGDFFTAVLKHKSGKWFGLLLRGPDSYFKRYNYPAPDGGELLNLKCPPDLQEFLIASAQGVLPAYHMNKKHWISIDLKGGMPFEDIKKLIELSFELTSKK